MMGERGPVPKRSNVRRRRNKDSTPQKAGAGGVVRVPALPKTVHPVARQWYRSLKESGQAQYFEPSDWAAALLLAEQMSRLMFAGNLAIQAKDYEKMAISGSQFSTLWSAMNDLLTTEASRRRVRLEIERVAPEETPPGVADINEFRRRMEQAQ